MYEFILTGWTAAFSECLSYDCIQLVRCEREIFSSKCAHGSTSRMALTGLYLMVVLGHTVSA